MYTKKQLQCSVIFLFVQMIDNPVLKTFSKSMSITVTVTKFTVAQKTLFLLSKKLVHQFTCEKNTSSRVRQVKYHLGHA